MDLALVAASAARLGVEPEVALAQAVALFADITAHLEDVTAYIAIGCAGKRLHYLDDRVLYSADRQRSRYEARMRLADQAGEQRVDRSA